VLQDRLFEPNASWSLPQHFMVSEWVGQVQHRWRPNEAVSTALHPRRTRRIPAQLNPTNPRLRLTDLTYLSSKNNVSWKYYVQTGTQPDCADDEGRLPARASGC